VVVGALGTSGPVGATFVTLPAAAGKRSLLAMPFTATTAPLDVDLATVVFDTATTPGLFKVDPTWAVAADIAIEANATQMVRKIVARFMVGASKEMY
jgi:hypothetical protein